MLLVAIVGKHLSEALRRLDEVHTLVYVSAKERNGVQLLSEMDQAVHVPAEALLLDVAAGPADEMARALNRYRCAKPGIRIILLAVGRRPGDAVVSALVDQGVSDVLSMEAAYLEGAISATLDRCPAPEVTRSVWIDKPKAIAAGPDKRRLWASGRTILRQS